jgi:hypothetical protein
MTAQEQWQLQKRPAVPDEMRDVTKWGPGMRARGFGKDMPSAAKADSLDCR